MIITEILDRNYRLYVEKTALIEIDPEAKTKREISWGDFYFEVEKVANSLQALGIKKGDKVSILMTNCLEWLPIYFGILKIGALASPLNFRFDTKEISYCINLVEANAIFFENKFIERISEAKKDIDKTIKDYIFVGRKEETPKFSNNYKDFLKIENKKKKDFPKLSILDNAALYFTSGTTGVPKAVLLNHRNLEFSCFLENNHHKQNHNDVFLCIPPLYHTGAKMHWFGSFLVGGKSVLLKSVKASHIVETIHQEKITVIWLLVPWIHDILIAAESGEILLENYDLSSLRLMHSGAQPIPPALIKKWKSIFPNQEYDTNYGLTESTGPGCVHLGMENTHKIGAIGKPGFDWEVKIIDKNNNELPFGETGELLIKGIGIMQEYYKNPDETKKTIQDGWLHTGDMARIDEAGFIWLVDRKKDVVISGGENIYPVQIEDFLMENKKIHDVAVIGIKNERLGEVPIAIIKPKKNQTLTEEEVIMFCQTLPKYKRPHKVFFDDVPRNPTGKIEKPKLRRKYSNIIDN